MNIKIDTAKILKTIDDAYDDPLVNILKKSNVNITKSLLTYNKNKTSMKNRNLLVSDMADIYMPMMLIQGLYGISSMEIERVINSRLLGEE